MQLNDLSSPSPRYSTFDSLKSYLRCLTGSNTHKAAGKSRFTRVWEQPSWRKSLPGPLTAGGRFGPFSADAVDELLIIGSSLHHVSVFALVLHLGIFGEHLQGGPVDHHCVEDLRGLSTRTGALYPKRGQFAPLTR